MVLPPWPDEPPRDGPVLLRPFVDADAAAAVELATDPYVPLIGSLPPGATAEEALAWVHRQQQRHAEGAGYSFAVADARTDEALGAAGLWLRHLDEGRATAGYAVRPSARGRGVAGAALRALTRFAWTVPGVDRVELRIEPWNTASVRVADAAGYRSVGVLPADTEIGGVLRDVRLHVADRPRHEAPDARRGPADQRQGPDVRT